MNICIIDDNDDVLAMLAELVQLCGHHPISYSSCEAVIEDIHNGSVFDLIITDKQFEGSMSGVVCAKTLEDMGNQTPLIIMTGEGRLPKSELTTHVKACLGKPFDFDTLKDTIEQATKN